jgi:hypothetical protein
MPNEDLPDEDLPDEDLPDADLPDADLPDEDLPDRDGPEGDGPAAGDPRISKSTTPSDCNCSNNTSNSAKSATSRDKTVSTRLRWILRVGNRSRRPGGISPRSRAGSPSRIS